MHPIAFVNAGPKQIRHVDNAVAAYGHGPKWIATAARSVQSITSENSPPARVVLKVSRPEGFSCLILGGHGVQEAVILHPQDRAGAEPVSRQLAAGGHRQRILP